MRLMGKKQTNDHGRASLALCIIIFREGLKIMIIQISERHWINVLQIVDVEVNVSKISGVECVVTMSNNKVIVVTREVESFVKELEEYRVPVRSGKK